MEENVVEPILVRVAVPESDQARKLFHEPPVRRPITMARTVLGEREGIEKQNEKERGDHD